MKSKLHKNEVERIIKNFFEKDAFSADELKKIKRIAMKFNIKLGIYRKSFCKQCLSQLRGRISIKKGYKSIICANCGHKNRYRI